MKYHGSRIWSRISAGDVWIFVLWINCLLEKKHAERAMLKGRFTLSRVGVGSVFRICA